MPYDVPYDVIVIGGGLAGATLAKTVAERGIRVLVLEREHSFRDRVRGEVLVSWGIAEAQRLGLYEPLLQSCGHDVRWWHTSQGTSQGSLRDLIATTPTQSGILTFSHPAMQTALLALAELAGAEVWRGVTVTSVVAGSPATVRVRGARREERVLARLVVGADGRNSRVRAWGCFSVQRDPQRRVIAGVLHEGLQLPEDTVQLVPKAWMGQTVLIIPIGKQRFRSYLMYRKRDSRRGLSGTAHEPAFLEACCQTGVPVEWYEGAQIAGPLAEFESAATWVDHPYRQGVVLVGDAAAAPDPTFGQGLSLTLRDVRVLCDHLLCTDDWAAAAHAYARAHDGYYGALHRVENWLGELFFEIGPDAEARRARAIPLHVQEPDRNLDLLAFGPDVPSDELARRRFFGEE